MNIEKILKKNKIDVFDFNENGYKIEGLNVLKFNFAGKEVEFNFHKSDFEDKFFLVLFVDKARIFRKVFELSEDKFVKEFEKELVFLKSKLEEEK